MVTKADDRDKAGGRCRGCGHQFPPGSDTCFCGRVEPRRGDPYPVASIDRYDWCEAQHVGNATAKAVLRVLIGHDKPEGKNPGTVFPSVARLAEIMECAETRVHRGLRYLDKHKWIVIERRHKAEGWRAPSHYTIEHPHSGIQTPILNEPNC